MSSPVAARAPSGGKGEALPVRAKKRDYVNADGVRTNPLMTANLLEYGSSHQPATPFARPTVEQNGEAAIRIVTEDLVKRVDKVAQQLLDQGRRRCSPNVYETLRANATVLSLVGENIGRHGSLQQSVQPPPSPGPTSPASRKTRSAVRPTPISTRSRSTAGRRTTPGRHAGARCGMRSMPGALPTAWSWTSGKQIPSSTASASTPTSSRTDRPQLPFVPPPGPLRAFSAQREGIRHVRKRQTQGSKLFVVDLLSSSIAAVVAMECPTGITGLGGAADQIEDTCLDDTVDKSFVRGLGTPGTVSVPFIPLKPQAASQQFLWDLKDAGDTVPWMIGLSDGSAVPALDGEAFDEPPRPRARSSNSMRTSPISTSISRRIPS